MFIKYTNVVGLQWGDEGKGRIVDWLAKTHDVIARYNGGNNAGHTVKVEDKEFKFHILPSGALYKKQLYIGPGAILDPHVLVSEIQSLEKYGIDFTGRLAISNKTNIILPYHKLLDECREQEFNFGTTKRGIGPAYADKYARLGVQIQDLFNEAVLKQKIDANLREKNILFTHLFNTKPLTVDEVYNEVIKTRDLLGDYITDLNDKFYSTFKDKTVSILLEGAQGLMLDVDSTDYPFVTSTHVNPKYHYIGLFDHNKSVDAMSYNNVGVMKAYATKVGAGYFPTEIKAGEYGEVLREKGKEFGTTTGRPRRVGWLDLVQIKKVLNENEINTLYLTKLDVLTGLELKICVEYDTDHQPVYKNLKGWTKTIGNCKSFHELPQEAKDYISFIEDFLGYKFKIISIGPERNQLLTKE